MKTTFYLFFVLIIFALVITACENDSPVISNNNPKIIDSIYFDWRFDTMLITPMSDIYIADTNQVFIPGLEYSVFYNNGVVRYINHHDPYFANRCVNGTNTKNVYFGGISVDNSSPKLKHWDGNEIKDIPIPNDKTVITRIEPKSDNDIWLSTNKNILYRYFNQSISSYRLDSGLTYGIVFMDNNNELFAHFVKYTSGTYNYLYIFKFDNNSWSQISKDSINEYTDLHNYIGFSDKYLLYSGKNRIHYFDGMKWDNYINTAAIFPIFNAGGGGKNNIMFRGTHKLNDYIFYYDGEAIYKMSYFLFPYMAIESIQYKYGKYYMTTGVDWMGNSYLGIAKFKKSIF